MKKIKEIFYKYGDFVFGCAVAQLIDLGASILKQMDIEAECVKIIEETHDRSIVSGDVLANILRCAADLAQLPSIDLDSFISKG